ncbi:Fe-Mn family superoxide dismutase [Constrictibacter sp. MBR-5]|jgi:Fe-Mn family superoxide dismutase|uniref:superoxide dismutase n=1 Tax=Constrictibacter sp. MBR-5 TaxID=3156467 RepID=UPI00339A56C4
MAFELPDLPYDRSALEPYMSARTLEFHHGKHHQAYYTALNNLVKDTPFASMSLEEIIKKTYNDSSKAGIFNNASQAWNHNLFWPSMKKGGGGAIPSELEKRIVSDFGSVDKFKEEFVAKGVGQFGSGWCWLVEEGGKLKCTNTPNGVDPLCFDQTTLLGCDVWEHSYYLDYQNRRPDYIKAFLDHLVNWEAVAGRLK